MRKWKRPSRLEPEAVPAPCTPIAAMPAAVLRLQRAAGNRAVTAALPIQRYRSQNVPADDVAEGARHGGAEPLSEKNLAVAYVAEQGSEEAKPETPVWSSGTQDPDVHAERTAVRQARTGGARLDYHPRETGAKRVVRVYTELAPCDPCSRWLAEQLHPDAVVQWTAPPQNPARWQAQVPNALWRTRVALLTELHGLRDQATSPEALAALERARNVIVSVVLTPVEWERSHPSEREAVAAAEHIDAGWKGEVAAARNAVHRPVPVHVPPVLAGPAPHPVLPAAPVRAGTLDQWLAGTSSPAVLAKKPAAPVLKGGGPAPHIKKAPKSEATCLDCGKKVTVNKTGKLRAHKNRQDAPCRGSRYRLL
ncbi:hypothetical protein AB0M80_06455 [Amycolatopsis sp. NPDC051045]|uniref:hypothetical protein n=1 Tax=Amycolatopsis sp. NPDC051045 TaxID=3156922 RepID=UPI003432CE07